MKYGTLLDIQLVDVQSNSVALQDVSIDVVLFIGGRERYRFDSGVTDVQGRVSTSYEMLERARKKNQAFALMDYNTKLEDCDDAVGLAVPSMDQLRGRLAAARKWFPENEPRELQRVTNSNNANVTAPRVHWVATNGSKMTVELPVDLRSART